METDCGEEIFIRYLFILCHEIDLQRANLMLDDGLIAIAMLLNTSLTITTYICMSRSYLQMIYC